MVFDLENIRYAHGAGHTDICFGIDGQILTCGSDGYVRIWEDLDTEDSSSDFVADQALSVACTGEHYLVATSNNYVQSYTYSDRKRDKIIFRFSAPVTHVVTSSSNKYIAACSCDMEIQVLNSQTNKIITLTGHTAPVLGLTFDPMEEYLASSSCDGTVKIWELSSGTVIKFFEDVIPRKNDFFKSLILGRCAWKTKSGLYFVVPKGLEVLVYKRNTWEECYRLSSAHIEKDLSAVLFSPCGNYLAAASSSGEIVIWETKHKSEVCHYKDSKNVGVSGIIWQPDGNKILFCDKLGRLGVLSGISHEILKHSIHSENKTSAPFQDHLQKDSDVPDPATLFSDDDEDNENCISLDKIKSSYNSGENDGDLRIADHGSDGDGEENPPSPARSEPDLWRETSIACEPQHPFQPTSTPRNFEPRCLCFNDVGMIRYYDSDKTIDIQFHDTTFHHSLFLRSFGLCTMASLSWKVICLAVPSVNDHLSKLTCICLSSWAGKKEWTVHMPQGEDILAVATSDDWVAAATNINNLRIFSHAGTQKQVVALSGRIVAMAGHRQKLFIVCHGGPGFRGSQNLIFSIYNLFGHYLRAVIPFQPLPISPNSTLRWLGFTEEGTASTFDTDGIVRLLAQDSLYWVVICDTKLNKKIPSDNYFIVGLSEFHQNIRCILCRNSQYPLFISNPTIMELPFKIPMCDMDDVKSISEEAFWRLMFSLYNIHKISSDTTELHNHFDLPMTQAILKLFGDASNNSEDLRAVDLAHYMTKKPLDIAIKYANNQGRTYLVEKLKTIKPINWTSQQQVHPVFSQPPDPEQTDHLPERPTNDFINSQQDLFEDPPTSFQKENNPSEKPPTHTTTHATTHATTVLHTKSCVNPFKRPNLQPKDTPKGLKYFDSLTKDSAKPSKPFNVSKPLKLKLSSNKESNRGGKPKKPTFVEWFGKKKAGLSEEYSNLSSTELTKLGMKLYKEEISGTNDENKILQVVDSDSEESDKGISSADPEPSSKRFKSSEESF